MSGGCGQPKPDKAEATDPEIAPFRKMIDRLEAAGFVEREEDRGNGRVKHLVLTAAGEAKLRELAHIPVEFNEDAMKDVSAEDVETFKRVLAKMVESVKE